LDGIRIKLRAADAPVNGWLVISGYPGMTSTHRREGLTAPCILSHRGQRAEAECGEAMHWQSWPRLW
jgi:hypothetical protein